MFNWYDLLYSSLSFCCVLEFFEYFFWLCGGGLYDWCDPIILVAIFNASTAVLYDFLIFWKSLLRLIFLVVVFIICTAFLFV